MAHLFTTIAAVVSVAIFLANQDKRLSILEEAVARQDRYSAEFKVEIRSDLREIKDDIKQIARRLK